MTELKPFRIQQVMDIEGKYRTIETDKLFEAARTAACAELANGPVLNSAETAINHLTAILGHVQHEIFAAVWLDSRNKSIEYCELFRGSINSSQIYPREVVKTALALNASSVIFVHNHPSGNPESSHADISITHGLKDVLKVIEVDILDHIVIGSHSFSMKSHGLF